MHDKGAGLEQKSLSIILAGDLDFFYKRDFHEL